MNEHIIYTERSVAKINSTASGAQVHVKKVPKHGSQHVFKSHFVMGA